MPEINVRFFANLREFTKTGELRLEGNTVMDILDKLCKKFPGFRAMIFKDGNLQPYVNVFLNGRNILEINGLGTPLEQDDEIAIFPPVSGG